MNWIFKENLWSLEGFIKFVGALDIGCSLIMFLIELLYGAEDRTNSQNNCILTDPASRFRNINHESINESFHKGGDEIKYTEVSLQLYEYIILIKGG